MQCSIEVSCTICPADCKSPQFNIILLRNSCLGWSGGSMERLHNITHTMMHNALYMRTVYTVVYLHRVMLKCLLAYNSPSNLSSAKLNIEEPRDFSSLHHYLIGMSSMALHQIHTSPFQKADFKVFSACDGDSILIQSCKATLVWTKPNCHSPKRSLHEWWQALKGGRTHIPQSSHRSVYMCTLLNTRTPTHTHTHTHTQH